MKAFFCAFNGATNYAYSSYHRDWDKNPRPAFVKLFFATEQYDLHKSSDTNWWNGASNYWWSDAHVTLDSGINQTIEENFDPKHWTDGMGHRGSDYIHLWLKAMREMKYIGVAFSGGQYYDMGIANPNREAEFQLLGFFEAEGIPEIPTPTTTTDTASVKK